MVIRFTNQATLANDIITLCLMVLVFGALFYCLYKVCKRKVPFYVFGGSVFFIIFSFIFCLDAVMYIAIAVMIVGLILSLFINLGDLRKFFANPFQVKQAKNTAFKVEKIFDKEEMYKQVEAAVVSLSKSRTGAIITFEKNTSLTDLMKNGVTIKAPVSAELLETIFYPGTRLHDGAVVIHGNEIVAASVFYTPTTKAFAGKYGSRHRAALGISEISDAVTVVVSEETGRISFAVNGTLESVDQANFLRVFENLMDESNK